MVKSRLAVKFIHQIILLPHISLKLDLLQLLSEETGETVDGYPFLGAFGILNLT